MLFLSVKILNISVVSIFFYKGPDSKYFRLWEPGKVSVTFLFSFSPTFLLLVLFSTFFLSLLSFSFFFFYSYYNVLKYKIILAQNHVKLKKSTKILELTTYLMEWNRSYFTKIEMRIRRSSLKASIQHHC